MGDTYATALIEGRYTFRISLRFIMDPEFHQVTLEKAEFRLLELRLVRVSPDGAGAGGASVEYQPDQMEFGLKEWQSLVAAKWNFKLSALLWFRMHLLRTLEAPFMACEMQAAPTVPSRKCQTASHFRSLWLKGHETAPIRQIER